MSSVVLCCCYVALGGGGGYGVSNGMHTGDEFFRLKFFLLGEMECILPINSLFALTILMGRRMLKVPVLEKDLACSLNFLLHIHTPLDHPWFVPIISSPLKNAKIVKYRHVLHTHHWMARSKNEEYCSQGKIVRRSEALLEYSKVVKSIARRLR